jgi:hypothetical protein
MLFSDKIHFLKYGWESNFAFFSIIQITNVSSDKNEPKSEKFSVKNFSVAK